MTESHDAVTEYVTVWKDHEPTKLRWGVPVVRCCDCKWFKPRNEECGGRNWCKRMSFEIEPDGFCAWGERKGDG